MKKQAQSQSSKATRVSCFVIGALTLAACDHQDESSAQAALTNVQDVREFVNEHGTQVGVSAKNAGAEFLRARTETRSASLSGWGLPRWLFVQVTPHLNCVDDLGDGRFRAHWGYTNHRNYTSRVRRGWWNGFLPFPLRRGQPTRFRPGTHDNVFQTEFHANDDHRWWLMWSFADASADSPRCGQTDLCEDVDCNDNNPCTLDECNPSNGSCVYQNSENGTSCEVNGEAGQCKQGACEALGCKSDAECQDKDACNGSESCGNDGVCAAGTALNCDDQNPCTVNSCDPESGCSTENVANGTSCEVNGEAGKCEAGSCKVLECQSDADCQDGNACNGAEVCGADGSCTSGTALNCDDQNPCTANGCDASSGCVAQNVEDGTSCEVNGEAGKCEAGGCKALECQSDADCQDGNACNGAEVCGADGSCIAGTALNCDDQNPCTADSCEPSTGCANVAANDNLQCSADGDQVGLCNAGSCSAFQLYTAGHGDLGFELTFDSKEGEFEPHIHVEGGTVNGKVLEDQEFSFNELAIVTNASFTRPSNDFGFFSQLCVEEGETVKWLPQSNTDANAQGVPFFGIAAEEIDAGVLVGDQVKLELVNVQSPDGTGHYSVWRIPSFRPEFSMASCDGIDGNDQMVIPLGHDHYNMGFSKGGLGLWRVTYKVSGTLAANNSLRESTFTVNYLIK